MPVAVLAFVPVIVALSVSPSVPAGMVIDAPVVVPEVWVVVSVVGVGGGVAIPCS